MHNAILNLNEKPLYETEDFLELVIKHIARSPKALDAAKRFKVQPNDFGSISVYQAFIKIILEIGEVPLNPTLFFTKVKEMYSTGTLLKSQQQQILDFWDWIHNDEPLNTEYVIEQLPLMLKHRRFSKLLNDGRSNPDELTSNLNALAFDFKHSGYDEASCSFSPFAQMIFKMRRESFTTGFRRIDEASLGLGLQELGMIIGYSGSGKTALATHSALQNVMQGKKVLYLSLEEPAENVCNRFYSNYFKINYSALHSGDGVAQAELSTKMAELSEQDIQILSNLRIEDLRNRTPVTADYIATYLDRFAQEKGFVPDLIYIDQMDYLESKKKYDSMWQKFESVAFEVDDLCNHLIAGEHKFAVWLLHQATGKMRRYFTNAEIAGFKGIIKPADLVIGIGKDKPDDVKVSLFSLKCRHAKNFNMDFEADLAFMRFEDLTAGETRSPGHVSTDTMSKVKKSLKERKLPAADGNFR